MRSAAAVILATLLALDASASALARPTGGGGGGRPAGGGGGRPAGGASRPAPASRPASISPGQSRPAPRPPQQNVTRPSGGFQLGNDAQRPNGGGNNTVNRPNGGGNNNVNRPNGGNNNVNINHNNNVNVNGRYGNRAVIANPVYVSGPAWGWNHGSPWYPASNYWGGGFWGALAISATSAAIYGSIVANNQTYNSYQIQPTSPGYTLLSNYGLQQVQCGPPGLVVMYGPNNSVICANPNGTVAAGNYDIDSQTLSLVSR
ncbi:MAG: hypothetical protein ACLQPV_08205 [Vulcanimicrobiaceae bacterium]